MKNYKDTYQNTLIASGNNNLKELARLTLLNILSVQGCLLYTSPSPRDGLLSRMPSSA